ncbi:hypothetical protein ACIA3K_23390 [Micromonospora sp. NPDC051543]|uniref:hypothetical protein n=1 Tax=Micromonospora sp. NPDC051543 TaxID=3364287 RepID=UPI0037A289E9
MLGISGKGPVVTDHHTYLNVHSRCAATFDLSVRLPDQVFREIEGESLFGEFDAVLAPDFWPALSAMARWHGDERVELLVLEPDCDTYYLSEYGSYPALSLSVEASEDDYWALIGHEAASDIFGSIAISANVIAVTGPSRRWGCWGERDPEVAVFRGFPTSAVRREWQERFGPMLDAGGALQEYLPLAFRGRTVPDVWAATLATNYGDGVVPARPVDQNQCG